jgi:hypothetical protein
MIYPCLRGLPICRSEKYLYSVDEEVLEQVQPYLEEWATLPQSETEDQRRQISEELGPGIAVNVYDMPGHMTTTGKPITIVKIQLDTWYQWERGMMYVHEDATLLHSCDRCSIRQVDEHLYTYNTQ